MDDARVLMTAVDTEKQAWKKRDPLPSPTWEKVTQSFKRYAWMYTMAFTVCVIKHEYAVRLTLLLRDTSPMRYDRRSSSQAIIIVQPRTRPFSHIRVWPCSSRAGRTTCSRRSSRESSVTGASLKWGRDGCSIQRNVVYRERERDSSVTRGSLKWRRGGCIIQSEKDVVYRGMLHT